jgi:hypothetical protein
VTVICSSNCAASVKSAGSEAAAATLRSFRVCRAKPLNDTVTEYTPGARLTE